MARFNTRTTRAATTSPVRHDRHAPSGRGNRHAFAGLTDSAFGAVALLEAGRNARWPWETAG